LHEAAADDGKAFDMSIQPENGADDGRVRRPELPRDHPIRSFTEFWTRVSQDSQRATSGSTGAQSTHDRPSGDFINDGVKNAYAVIDRYIREGYEVANQLSQSYDPGPWLESGRQLQAQVVQTSSDLIATWFNLFGVFTELIASYIQNPSAAGLQAPLAQATAADSPLPRGPDPVFEVLAQKPTRVQANLSPGAHRFQLAGSDARNPSGAILRFDVSTSASGPVIVSVKVPLNQESGEYRGNIINDRTGEIMGTFIAQVQ
jgi:hypothetical protein